jgi:hypothetical protein
VGFAQAKPVTTKLHVQKHKTNIGIWYENPIYYQFRVTKDVPNHGDPGGLLAPIHVYLLRSPFDARRTKMEAKYVLPSPQTLTSVSAAKCNFLVPGAGTTQHHTQPPPPITSA